MVAGLDVEIVDLEVGIAAGLKNDLIDDHILC
jgi:hypothetical protein